MKQFWMRLDRPIQVAVSAGLVLAVLSIPLPTLIALVVGLASAVILGYIYPSEATKVGVAVAAPVLLAAFIAGFVRGFSTIVLIIFLVCSLILPVGAARLGSEARVGRST